MVPDTEEQLEIKGRLFLWADAASECRRLLELASKAEGSMHSDAVQARQRQSIEAYQSWVQMQPDYDPKQGKMSHLVEFDKTERQDFGTFVDLLNTKNYLRMLAVVFFCQILNNGGRSEGAAAANTKAFRSVHFDNVLNAVFKTASERSQFELLREKLLVARDKMLGHADGPAFSITHGETLTSSKMYYTSIESIDFAYFASFLEPMVNAIYDLAVPQRTRQCP